MSAAELAGMVVDLTRELSEARRERDAWRLVAIEAIHHGHHLQRAHARLEERYSRFLSEQRGLDRQANACDGREGIESVAERAA